jgi:transposase
MTIPGVGEKTAHALLALAPELGRTNRRQIASLMGLAPHMQQSGQKTWYARTSGRRRSMRPILFLAAMAARKSHSSFKTFYETHQQGQKTSCSPRRSYAQNHRHR